MVNFDITDETPSETKYKTIVESVRSSGEGQEGKINQLFDAKIEIFDDVDSQMKAKSLDAVDIKVRTLVELLLYFIMFCQSIFSRQHFCGKYALIHRTRRFDGQVRAEVGRVKFVFLMKFVNDLLRFLDPFINDQNVQDAAKAQAAAAQAAASAGLSSIYR